ncbi:beta-lactamase/transpeptidase-like protein [Hypoxylon sp. NC1633]|nr:beta-lactamase/transpeptidase-like protein [Hypoxylon sp. NC1633]
MTRLAPRLSLAAAAALSTAVLAQHDHQSQRLGQKVLGVGQEGPEERTEQGASGRTNGNPLGDRFGTFVAEALDRWHVPGLAVAVVDGEDTWAEGYGISSFPSTPVTPSTLFYTGSTTKAFTAAVVSLLIDSGNFSSSSPSSSYLHSQIGNGNGNVEPLSWQTPIAHLIGDDFTLQPEHSWAATHLTLEDALSHRTGFPRHDKALARRYGDDDAHPGTVRDVARSLRFLPMVAEPRVRWRYCNLMFMVVSHVVQELTGRWLGDSMREWVWRPLGMERTFLGVEEPLRRGLDVARGYYWDYEGADAASGEGREGKGKGRGRGFVEVPYANLDIASGAGGVVSNVLDYAKWIRCLISGCGVLPKEAHRELKAARVVLPPESGRGFDAPLSYALGWQVATYKGHRLFTHGGDMEAYGAEVYFFPDLGYGVVTMGNTELTSNFLGRDVAWRLINDRVGVPEEDRFDWAGLGEKVVYDQLKVADTAVDTLYPERANPPLPRALPLEKYVGVYGHPAYQNITIELTGEDNSAKGDSRPSGKGQLKAVRDNMVWQMTFEFRHVSGEFWAVVIDMLNTPNGLGVQLARAEFVVGVKGNVDKLKMEFLEDGSEGVIVFDKIA